MATDLPPPHRSAHPPSAILRPRSPSFSFPSPSFSFLLLLSSFHFFPPVVWVSAGQIAFLHRPAPLYWHSVAATLHTVSAQNCESFGKNAQKCRKAGCFFAKVDNAKFKTCVTPAAAAASVGAADTAAIADSAGWPTNPSIKVKNSLYQRGSSDPNKKYKFVLEPVDLGLQRTTPARCKNTDNFDYVGSSLLQPLFENMANPKVEENNFKIVQMDSAGINYCKSLCEETNACMFYKVENGRCNLKGAGTEKRQMPGTETKQGGACTPKVKDYTAPTVAPTAAPTPAPSPKAPKPVKDCKVTCRNAPLFNETWETRCSLPTKECHSCTECNTPKPTPAPLPVPTPYPRHCRKSCAKKFEKASTLKSVQGVCTRKNCNDCEQCDPAYTTTVEPTTAEGTRECTYYTPKASESIDFTTSVISETRKNGLWESHCKDSCQDNANCGGFVFTKGTCKLFRTPSWRQADFNTIEVKGPSKKLRGIKGFRNGSGRFAGVCI